jgi:hypothetical protein
MPYGRKVSIIPTASGPGAQPVVIFDETVLQPYIGAARPDACEPGFLFGGDLTIQETALDRSAYPFAASRFNVKNGLELLVLHTFTTYGACQDFAAQRRDGIPGAGKLSLLTSTEQGIIQRSYAAVTIPTVKCTKLQGVSCTFRYVIRCYSPYLLTP